MSSSDYVTPFLAHCFNLAFPRYDLTFLEVNTTFSPTDPRYRESLIIWAAVPVLWLVFTLLIFLMYFCYRCCQRDVEKKQRVPCLRWSMAIFALLTCAVLGVGFYGNEDVHKGMTSFSTAASDADHTTARMKSEVAYLQRIINETVDRGIEGMQQIFRTHPQLDEEEKADLQRLSQKSMGSARSILHSALAIQSRASKVNMGDTHFYSDQVGFWLWIGIIILLGCFVLLCLTLLLGIGRSSKCILLLFCALGIISLVVCWIATGLFFGTTIGVSDFCMEPDTYFEKIVTKDLHSSGNNVMINGVVTTSIEKDVLRYYVTCKAHIVSNPFKDALRSAQESVRQANNTLNRALDMAYKADLKQQLMPYVIQVHQGLDDTIETIFQLTALVECTNLHKDYSNAIKGVCYTALPGFALLLLSTTLTGLLLTVLVLMASRAWRHFSRRKGYQEVDEDDPFLPRPDPNSPSYYRYEGSSRPPSLLLPDHASLCRGGDGSGGTPPPPFTRQGPRGRGGGGAGGEQISMQRRNTPPPAYNSYDPRVTSGMMRPPPQAPIAPHDDDDSYFGRETYA